MPPSRWLWRESHGHVRPSALGTKSWLLLGLPGGSAGKESTPSNAGDLGSIPGWGRSPGGGHGSPLQCSCLENPTDRGAWRAAVHGAAQSQTRLSDEAHRLQTAGLACSLWGERPAGLPLPEGAQTRAHTWLEAGQTEAREVTAAAGLTYKGALKFSG